MLFRSTPFLEIEGLTKLFGGVRAVDNVDFSIGQDEMRCVIGPNGCGKTTLSTNLADAIAASGAGKVCLVDFDLQFGDIGIALRVNPVKTLKDLVEMSSHVDRQAVTSLVINVKPNFDVLLAPSNPVDAEYITGELCGNVLHQLQDIYDYIVIDSAPAFTDVVLEAFDTAEIGRAHV